ncbi:MAG: DegT/DnrJ/EryC1/StrS family aminotransferase [Candidatus Pacearchaeota archaeon]
MKKNGSWKRWGRGDTHLINRIQWDGQEVKEMSEVLESDWFGYGPKNELFEKKLSQYTGIPYINGTNSGSSAIQVALLGLKHEGRWRPGDLVIHPVTTFATSISSAIYLGLNPIYVETKPHTYVVDPEQVSRAVERFPEARGMILPYILGNVPDVENISKILGKGRFLVEDCCDTLGSKFNGKHIGSFGDYAAFSFYASHHVTAGGVGGAVGTSDKRNSHLAKSLIFWGRDFRPGDEEFLKRYTYETLGTDSQMSALQAAFGIAQIEKLPEFVKARAEQFKEMTELFSQYNDLLDLPVTHSKAAPSWFSYPLTIKDNTFFDRSMFAKYLRQNGVEGRPIMCGNITRQKPFERVPWHSLNNGKFPIGDEIEEKSLFLPCWGMPRKQRGDYYKTIERFLKSHT